MANNIAEWRVAAVVAKNGGDSASLATWTIDIF